ncbi:MAG: chemotaxis protein CheB [Candidatus Kariarchaeaceae archaeon]
MSFRIIVVDADTEKRNAIIHACEENSNIEVMKRCNSGKEGLILIKTVQPKIVIIGNKLSDMSGYAFVTKVMKEQPVPILVVVDENKSTEIDHPEALDYGIVDTILITLKDGKIPFPKLIGIRINILAKLNLERFQVQIDQINKFKRSRFKEIRSGTLTSIEESRSKIPKYKIDTTQSPIQTIGAMRQKVIVMGASTGGPRMLVYLISQFPQNFPPVLVVQHMPTGFVSGFAERMDQNAQMKVKMAEEGDIVRPGVVYIAPGGYHMELEKKGSGLIRIKISDGAKVNFVKPAVDVTLFSATREYGSGVISVILTGMGADGREGSRVVKKSGGTVYALNEEDSVIYGMNKAVIDAGLADQILGMDAIVKELGSTVKTSQT